MTGQFHSLKFSPLEDFTIYTKLCPVPGLIESSIQAEADAEREFSIGFNSVSVIDVERSADSLRFEIDLSTLDRLDPINQDIYVSLFTIPNPFEQDPEFTLLAIDATRGEIPHAYSLRLADLRRVIVDNPQRQETVRRSRELIAQQEELSSQLIERDALTILSANIVMFGIELEDR